MRSFSFNLWPLTRIFTRFTSGTGTNCICNQKYPSITIVEHIWHPKNNKTWNLRWEISSKNIKRPRVLANRSNKTRLNSWLINSLIKPLTNEHVTSLRSLATIGAKRDHQRRSKRQRKRPETTRWRRESSSYLHSSAGPKPSGIQLRCCPNYLCKYQAWRHGQIHL